MKHLKTICAAAAVLACMAAIAAAAATYSVAEIKSTAPQGIAGIGVGLAKYCHVQGALGETESVTVTVSRISGVVTTAVATVVCTDGAGAGAANSNMYLIAGDSLIQSGATNTPTVRLIYEE